MVVAMGLIYVLWGSTYIAIKISVETLPAMLAAGLRYLIAGALLVPFVLARRPTRRELGGASILGVWLLVGGPGLLTLAETRVPSNIAAILASTTAITICVWRLLAGERLARGTIVGVLVGFAGVALLLAKGGAGISLWWMALTLASALAWSTASFYGRRLPAPSLWSSVGIQSLVAGVVMCGIGLLAGDRASGISARSALAVAYLVIAGSVGYGAYVWLLKNVAISTVVTHQYVNPIVALVLGALILGESLTGLAIAGACLVIGSVVAIVRAEANRTRTPAPQEG